MNKSLLVAGAIVLALLVLMFWGKSTAAPAGSNGGQPANHAGAPAGATASPLTPSETLYDFGTISMKNGLAERLFTVTNNTSAPVRVTGMYTSCMCTTAFFEGKDGEKGPYGMQGMGYRSAVNDTIGAGESRQVKVVFDPNAHGPAGVGAIDRVVYLEDEKGGVLELEVKAVVTP